MSSKELPQRWADRMVERGFTDPRYTSDIPSLSRLAEACELHTSTISSAIKGTGRRPSAATVMALTKALGDDVAEWLGERRPSAWELPAEAELLSDRQQKAIVELIMSMTERREDVGQDAAATSQAPGSGAPSKDELAELRRRQEEADATPAEHIAKQAAEHDDEGE